jgi:3-hydroxyanthranilate 3,4-dioxygenase
VKHHDTKAQLAKPSFPLSNAFSLEGWIEQHLPVSQGAIGNREVFKKSDFIFQVIKGPNARNDWHIDPWDEIFYQLQGHIFVYTMEDGKEVHHRINEGELFLLPKYVWHSPRRPPGSLGLVIERPRIQGEEDGIAWFCGNCRNMLHSVFFWCEDIEVTLKGYISEFNASEELRTCKKCGTVLADPTKVPQWEGDSWR